MTKGKRLFPSTVRCFTYRGLARAASLCAGAGALTWISCGALAPTGDAGADAAPEVNAACDPSLPFASPIAVSELNIGSVNIDMRLTTDELTAVFGTGDGSSAFANQAFIATRPNLQQPFTATLAGIDTIFTNPVAITNDQLHLYYYGCQGLQPNNLICESTRNNSTASFGFEAGAQGSGTSLPDSIHYEYSASLAPDVLEVLYTVAAVTDAGAWNVIAESARDSIDANFTTSTIVVNPPTNVDNATTNSGRLVVFFSEQDASGANHIWTGTRSTTSEPFSNLTPVHELDSTGGEFPTWFSDDGCRLYFTRGSFTQSSLYVASR